MQLSAVRLLALALTPAALARQIPEVNATNAWATVTVNGTNATMPWPWPNVTNGTNATMPAPWPNVTNGTNATMPAPWPTSSVDDTPRPPSRSGGRKVTTELELPDGKTFADVQWDMHVAIENTILVNFDFKDDVETIFEQVAVSPARQAHALGELIQVAISFRDAKTGSSAEMELRRKCALDAAVVDLEKQLADPNSALRQAIPYLTGAQSTSGVVSPLCDNTPASADDGLSGGVIAGIVIGSLVFVGIVAAIVCTAMKKPDATIKHDPVNSDA
eukprot:TRINITY_DN81_c0_g2_i2.p2 TRINITY_DN81_c0_g2~~TRINITY_DN81_c0_g2_i2.p2  ORF type:complete len:275 (+),score=57.86 TRINITY_DN81_c0_g2_i2:57-881(+)